MTQHKTSRDGLPGLSTISDIVCAYSAMWERQVQVVNEVWTDCTCEEATASDWPKAWNKLLRTWTDNAQDLCDLFISHAASHTRDGAPLVTFVIDRSAETDAGRQTVRLPPGVDAKNLVATPLVALTKDGHPAIDNAKVQLLSVNGQVEIGITVDKIRPEPGYYLSVVCEPKAGAPPKDPLTISQDPPLRTVVATVLVIFI